MKVVYTDIHLESPIATYTLAQFDAAMVNDLFRGIDVYLIGDIWDFAGCAKDRVPALMIHYKYWHAMVKQVNDNQKYSGKLHIIDGNHERQSTTFDWILEKHMIFVHGDFIKWGKKKAVKYRSKDHGASKFKRKFIIPVIEWAEKFGVNRVTRKMKKNAIEVLKAHNASIIICGHVHPQKRIDEYLGGNRKMIVLPRGRNEL